MSADASSFRLAVVGVGRVRGQILIAGCPGRGAHMPSPWNVEWRLRRDVANLRHWGVAALVTLMEQSELASIPLAELPELLAAHGIEWYHVPLASGCFPEARFESSWCAVSPRLRTILWRGGRIALHCADGRARAPLIAAKLLVELGCPGLDALNRVRGARPGVLVRAEEHRFILRQLPLMHAEDCAAPVPSAETRAAGHDSAWRELPRRIELLQA